MILGARRFEPRRRRPSLGRRRRHRFRHRGLLEVRGAGASLALAEVNGHGQALVTVILEGFDLTHAHGGRQARATAGACLGLARTEFPGPAEGRSDPFAQEGNVTLGACGHG